MGRFVGKRGMTSGSYRPDSDLYRRLCQAREFIEDCYARQINLERIAEQACLSPFHFLRVFRAAFNKTPHQYRIDRRIERAKELLGEGKSTVTEICFEVGFDSLGSFSTLFQKRVGQPPVRYRARMFIPTNGVAAYLRVPPCFVIMHRTENPRFR